MYQKHWLLNVRVALSRSVQQGISALFDVSFPLSFFIFKISFCVWRNMQSSFVGGTAEIPVSFISNSIVWLVQSAPPQPGWKGAAFSLLPPPPAGTHELMAPHGLGVQLRASCFALNLPVSEPAQHLPQGGRSATLIPTDWSAGSLLPRFCRETTQGTERHYGCTRAAKCSFWGICRKDCLNFVSLKLCLGSVQKNHVFSLRIWFSVQKMLLCSLFKIVLSDKHLFLLIMVHCKQNRVVRGRRWDNERVPDVSHII